MVTSPANCGWTPVQQAAWCGFEWDTEEFRVRISKEKEDRIVEAARKILKNEKVLAKEVASFTGLVISCMLSLGRMARFRTRFAVMHTQEGVDSYGRKAWIEINDQIRDELKFWETEVKNINDQLIWKSASIRSIHSYAGRSQLCS